jgi:hypothetical protein
MSNTRRADPGGELNQERYASSPLLNRGLNAIPLKLRCETLSDERDIELVWFLQYLSMRPGGIAKVAETILIIYPEHLGTSKMLDFGTTDTTYNAEQVRALRDTDAGLFNEDIFILRDEPRYTREDLWLENTSMLLLDDEGIAEFRATMARRKRERAVESRSFPTSYPVAAFTKICRDEFLKKAPELLVRFCLDPEFFPEELSLALPVFNDFRGVLLNYMKRWERDRLAALVTTEIGRKIIDAMDYAEAERVLVLIEGEYGTGKTFISKAWCEARPGKRRYIQAPSSNDNLDFFRTIAEPIGVSHALSMKSQQMRARINAVLQSGHLTIVLDEAHYMFPQASARVALPAKINWVLTALTNYQVPVALVATPQFTSAQLAVERQTHWASGQFIGRISRYVQLPESLDREELRAIARCHLPEGDAKSIDALVLYAEASKKRLRGIEHGMKSARHVARQAGRTGVTLADIKQALRDSVLPSDTALNNALSRDEKPTSAARNKRAFKGYAAPLQPLSKPISAPDSERESDALSVIPDRPNKRSISASLSTAEL